MSYGLPAEGDLDWADPLNNSVETTYAAAQAAAADAASAKSNAIYAANKVDSIGELDAERVSYALQSDSTVQQTLSATYTQFTDVNGDPLPPGHIVQIRLSADLTEIDDIVVVEA